MIDTFRINTTLDHELLERIDAFAGDRMEDRATPIRQLVDLALRERSKREAVEAYRQGRVTPREFGRVLAFDIWKAQELLMAEGVAVAQGWRSETADALDAAVADTR